MQISSFQEEEAMAGTFITRAEVTPEWAATSCHTVSTRSVSMKGLGTRRRVPLFAAVEISRSKRNRFRGYRRSIARLNGLVVPPTLNVPSTR